MPQPPFEPPPAGPTPSGPTPSGPNPNQPSTTRSDPELIAAVREGNMDAYGELFRRHESAVRRLALHLAVNRTEAEDLILRTYTEVFHVLQAGGGPRVAFRTYALMSLLGAAPQQPGGGLTVYGYDTLPEDWQVSLWHTEVERDPPDAIAVLLGRSTADVEGLAARARAAIRRHAAGDHLAHVEAGVCLAAADRLALLPDIDPNSRVATELHAHLERCERCETLRVRLAALDEQLGFILASAALHRYARGYLGSPTVARARVPAYVRIGRRVAGSHRRLAGTAVAAAATLAFVAWGLMSYAGNGTSLPGSEPPLDATLTDGPDIGSGSESPVTSVASPSAVPGLLERTVGQSRTRATGTPNTGTPNTGTSDTGTPSLGGPDLTDSAAGRSPEESASDQPGSASRPARHNTRLPRFLVGTDPDPTVTISAGPSVRLQVPARLKPVRPTVRAGHPDPDTSQTSTSARSRNRSFRAARRTPAPTASPSRNPQRRAGLSLREMLLSASPRASTASPGGGR